MTCCSLYIGVMASSELDFFSFHKLIPFSYSFLKRGKKVVIQLKIFPRQLVWEKKKKKKKSEAKDEPRFKLRKLTFFFSTHKLKSEAAAASVGRSLGRSVDVCRRGNRRKKKEE